MPNDNLLKEVKDVMIGAQAAGAVISCLVIAIGQGAVMAYNKTMLIKNGGLWNSLKIEQEVC